MAKVTFEYTIPEERHEFKLHSKASDMYVALWDIKEEVRKYLRYNKGDNMSKEVVVDKIYEFICEACYEAVGDEL